MIKGFSAHLDCLYPDLDGPDRCSAAADDGFMCVEMWAPPDRDISSQMIERLEQLDLSLASVNTNQGPEPGDFGLVGAPDYVDYWRDDFLATLGFARSANSRAINVLLGGRRQGATRTAQVRCLLENLDWALGQLVADDPVLLLEPLSAADRRSPLLQSAGDVLSVISQLGTPPGLLLLFDAYHLFQEEDDLIETLHLVGDRIGHVQLADYPGRAEPGTGELPVARFLTELAQTNYSGWIGLEYFPSGREETPFSWLKEYGDLGDRSESGIVL